MKMTKITAPCPVPVDTCAFVTVGTGVGVADDISAGALYKNVNEP